MRNTFAIIGFVVVAFLGVGWYMGWYRLSVTKTDEGNIQIKTDVDTSKVGSDSVEMLKNVGTVVGDQMKKAGKDGTAPTGTPGATPGPVTSPQSAPNAPVTPAQHLVPAPPDGGAYRGPTQPAPPRAIQLIAPR